MRRILACCLMLALVCLKLEAKDLGQRAVMDNGLVVLVSEQHKLPIVTFSLMVKAGSYYEPSAKAGLANLTASLLTEGTLTRTATEISNAIDFLGASLGSSAGADTASLNLTVLKKYLGQGMEIFGDALLHPTFPEAEQQRAVKRILAELKRQEQEPEELAQRTFLGALFGDHPYGRLAEGKAETLPNITREDLVNFYGRYYLPDNAILAIVGDITKEEALGIVQKCLGSWKKGDKPVVKPEYQTPALEKTVVKTIDKDLTQATVIWGHPGLSRLNPDWYAVTVLNYILGGGGFASRLFEKIRVENALVYDVDSYFDAKYFPSFFQVNLQTKDVSTPEALKLMAQEIQRIRTEPVGEKEFENARSFLTGYFPMRLDTNAKIAAMLLNIELFGLGLDYVDKYPKIIRKLTREDVLRVAKTYLNPEKYVLVVVGDQSKIHLDQDKP